MAGQHQDPHAELHDLAQGEHQDHEPALGDGGAQAEGDWQEALNKLDQRLTKRINELRKDFDTTKKAISNSVKQISDDVGTLKTSVENNTASIESLGKAVETATKHADEAKKAADAATAKAGQVEHSVQAFRTEYEGHTHGVQISLSGETQPPQHGGHTPKQQGAR